MNETFGAKEGRKMPSNYLNAFERKASKVVQTKAVSEGNKSQLTSKLERIQLSKRKPWTREPRFAICNTFILPKINQGGRNGSTFEVFTVSSFIAIFLMRQIFYTYGRVEVTTKLEKGTKRIFFKLLFSSDNPRRDRDVLRDAAKSIKSVKFSIPH